MKHLIVTLALALTAFTARPAEKLYSVMVNSSGVVVLPDNFWTANNVSGGGGTATNVAWPAASGAGITATTNSYAVTFALNSNLQNWSALSTSAVVYLAQLAAQSNALRQLTLDATNTLQVFTTDLVNTTSNSLAAQIASSSSASAISNLSGFGTNLTVYGPFTAVGTNTGPPIFTLRSNGVAVAGYNGTNWWGAFTNAGGNVSIANLVTNYGGLATNLTVNGAFTGTNGTFTGTLTAGSFNSPGAVTAAAFGGDGAGITGLSGPNITSGVIGYQRLSSDTPTSGQVFTFNGTSADWQDAPSGTNGGATASTVTNIARYVSGRAPNLWFNVRDYGAVGDGSTDDTAAINATVAAAFGGLAATNGPINAVIYFPDPSPEYRISGVIDIPSKYLPSSAFYTNYSTMTFYGDMTPALMAGTATTGPLALVGPIITSTATGSNVFQTFAPGWGPYYATAMQVNFFNLDVRVSDAFTGKVFALTNAPGARFENVNITRTNMAGSISRPDPASVGIDGPNYNEGNLFYLNNINIVGFGDGIRIGEHATIPWMNLGSCLRGVVLKTSNLGNSLGHITAQGCNYPVFLEGGNVNIDDLVVETTGGWQTNIAHVASTSPSTGEGIIFLRVQDNIGSQHNTIIKENANRVRLFNKRDGTWWDNNTSGTVIDRGIRHVYTANGAQPGAESYIKQRNSGTYPFTPQTVNAGEALYDIWFGGYNGTSKIISAYIGGYNEFTGTGTNFPVGLRFGTGTNEATSVTQMTISSTGTVTVRSNLVVGLTVTGNLSGGTNINASNLASGTVPTARLGSGTASSSTYLRGDGAWATPSASASLPIILSSSSLGDVFLDSASNPTLQWDDGASQWVMPGTVGFRTFGNIYASAASLTNANASTLFGSGTIPAQYLPVRSTNAAPISIGLSNTPPVYFTNITGNITLGLFANLHVSEWRQAQLWATNGTATDYTVTLPVGTKTPDGTLTYYVTNGTRRLFSIGGILSFTNAATSTFR